MSAEEQTIEALLQKGRRSLSQSGVCKKDMTLKSSALYTHHLWKR